MVSDYPLDFINKHLTTAIENPITTPSKKKKNKETEENKQEYLLKIPYVSKPFTRIVKKHVKKCGVNAKVVVSSGKTIKKMALKYMDKCTCFSCKGGIPCNQWDFVYQATCIKCNTDKNGKKAEYVGVSGRPGGKIYGEHEQSIRGKNTRTTLGQHVIEKHNRIKEPKIGTIFKFKTLKNCKDTLEAFLADHKYIKKLQPTLNNNFRNGFIF